MRNIQFRFLSVAQKRPILKSSLMNIPRHLVVDNRLTRTLSIESSTDSDIVYSFYIESINIKSVLVVFRVNLFQLKISHLLI